MGEKSRLFYEFGPFRVDQDERRLSRDGAEVVLRENGKEEKLSPKSFDLLLALLEHQGRMVRREELLEHLWPGTFVEDNRLSDNISTLRKFLGDTSKNSKFIETVPKYGYRFVAEVREVSDEVIAVVDQRKTHILIEESENPSPVTLTQGTPISLNPTSPPKTPARLLWTILIAFLLIAAVSISAAIYLRRPAPVVAMPAIKSIAVLPFKPLVPASGDPALELGMTDALINKLANVRQITVRPTSSVMKYASSTQNLRAAGEELKVDVLLDGKVQRDGDRIRVSVQLVRVGDETPLWADKFETQFKDIFAVQDVISEKVARALALKLSVEEQKGLSKRYTESAEAYQLYLTGRAQWRTFQPKGFLSSINYYRAALEKDANYALAHAGIADAYTLIGIYGPLTAREAMPKAQEAAHRAIELDENLSQAHLALGLVKLLYEWDWDGARRELERAIELDPNGEGRAPYGYYFEAMRKSDESLAQLKRARELAPGWDIANNDYAWHLFIERRYDEAIAASEAELKLDPDNPTFLMILGITHTQLGKYELAVNELQRATAIFEERHDPYASVSHAELGATYALMGKRQEALREIAAVQKHPISLSPFLVAEVYTSLGDKDAAFAALERGFEARCPFLWEIRSFPQFEGLRSDARYANLLRRMNLSPVN